MAARSSAALVGRRAIRGGGRGLLTRVAAAVAGGGLGGGGRCGRLLREARILIRRSHWRRRGLGRGPAVLGFACVGGRREPESADSGQRGQDCCSRQISE